MTVGMYHRPVAIPIMSTYVPIDFDLLYKIGAAQNEIVGKAAADLNAQLLKFGEFTSISDLDVQDYYNSSVGQMRDLLDLFASNPDAIKDPSYRAALQGRLNSIDYNHLAALKKSAENMDTREKARAALVAQGKYVDWFDDPRYTDLRNWSTKDQGIMADLSPAEYTSLEEVGNPYVKDLKPTFYKGVSPNTGLRMPFTNWMAISRDNIKQSLVQHYDDIISSPSGRKHFARWQLMYLAANPDATPQDIVNSFVERLVDEQSDKLIETPVVDTAALLLAKMAQDRDIAAARAGRKTRGGSDEDPIKAFNFLGNIVSTGNKNLQRNVDTILNSNETLKAQNDAMKSGLEKAVRDFAIDVYGTDTELGQAMRQVAKLLTERNIIDNMDDPDQLTSTEWSTIVEYAIQAVLDKNSDEVQRYSKILQEYLNKAAELNYELSSKLISTTIAANFGNDEGSLTRNLASMFDSGSNLGFSALDDATLAVMGNNPLTAYDSDIIKTALWGNPAKPLTPSVIRADELKNHAKSPFGFLYNEYPVFKNAADEAANSVNYDLKNGRGLLSYLNENGISGWGRFGNWLTGAPLADFDQSSIRDEAAEGKYGNLEVAQVKSITPTKNPNEFAIFMTVKVPAYKLDEEHNKWYMHQDFSNTLEKYESVDPEVKVAGDNNNYFEIPIVVYKTLTGENQRMMQGMYEQMVKMSTKQKTGSDVTITEQTGDYMYPVDLN